MFLKGFMKKLINIDNTDSKPWGVLKSLNDNYSDVELVNNIYIFGRKSDNNNNSVITLTGNKISHQHFRIFLSENKAHIQDISRNGTFINGENIGKGNIVTLNDNDIIQLGHLDDMPKYKVILYEINMETSDSDYSDVTLEDTSDTELNEHHKRILNNSVYINTKKIKGEDKGKEKMDDILDDELKCGICYAIMYNATTCSPCMHSFCAGCLSQWLKNSSKECPHCRTKIREIRKNNQTNNIINAFLEANPDKKRPDDELADLDEYDTIKNNIIRYEEKNGNDIKYLYKNEYEFYYLSCPNCPSSNENNGNNDIENDQGHGEDPTQVLIRRYEGPNQDANYRVKRKALPQYADYRCPPRSVHILCHACRQQMPLRCKPYRPLHQFDNDEEDEDDEDNDDEDDDDDDDENDSDQINTNNGANNNNIVILPNTNTNNHENPDGIDPDINLPEALDIPQQCYGCKNYYCDKYMENGCENITGRLDKFEDITMADIPPTAFRRNNFEKQILVNYLDSKNLTVLDCWKTCVTNLLNKSYTLGNIFLQDIHKDTYICYNCSRQIFSELIYQYRDKEVNKEDLPENIRKRPDCWYGKNCRTQTNKPEHARNYNHICEQTHF
ncbi:hypothetical protein H8356DRAFT_1637303 [Neocallimastix lanati (nom. inval.)]|nr:hypothetical protein H8356DRAFT_1637303 [Neocallimastix sp. JGI-2020a]